MFGRRKTPALPIPTKEQIIAKWKVLCENSEFIYSENFKGLDDDIRLALCNRLLDRFLDDFRRYLDDS
jgi:hypothetical protein